MVVINELCSQMAIHPTRPGASIMNREHLFDLAEQRERKCMNMLVNGHPHLSDLIPTPQGSFAWNDGWLTSGETRITCETKIRWKYIEDPIYLNTAKHFALLNMAKVDGSTPVLFDFCERSRRMLVVNLSLPGVIHSADTHWHRIKQRRIPSKLTYYPSTSIIDVYDLKYWISNC